MENSIAGHNDFISRISQKFHTHFGHLVDQSGKRVHPDEIVKWFDGNPPDKIPDESVQQPPLPQNLSEWQNCPKCGRVSGREEFFYKALIESLEDRIKQLTQEALPQNDYWQKRCEAAENKLKNLISQLPSGDL